MFAAVCVVLSALGHVLAACAAVPWWTVAVGFAVVVVLAVPFAGRVRSLAAVVSALAAGQLGLHVLFGLGQQRLAMGDGADDALIRMAARLVCGGAGAASLNASDARRIVVRAGLDPHDAAPAAHSGHLGHLSHSGQLDAAHSLGAGDAAGLLPGLPMVLVHLFAALATGWLLRRGDLALLKLVRLSRRGADEVAEEALRGRSLRAALLLVQTLLTGAALLPVPGPRGRRADDGRPPAPAVEALAHSVIRRGPPAVLVLAA